MGDVSLDMENVLKMKLWIGEMTESMWDVWSW